jgi:hypothetical protein
MVKICVTWQPFVVGASPSMFRTAGLVEDTVIRGCTLATVGTPAGLQPKYVPSGTPLMTGAVQFVLHDMLPMQELQTLIRFVLVKSYIPQ